MRELETVQRKEKLNKVFAVGEKGNGGANHTYLIVADEGFQVPEKTLFRFQNRARKEPSSDHGVIDSDLLEIVKDRVSSFQNGPFSSKENEEVLFHVEQALYHMNQRVENRIKRNVLGTNVK